MANRDELKRAYKESTPAMGVFVIRNRRNGRFLLHATRNLKGGMNRLRVEITPSTNPNAALLADWREMGWDAFEVRVLDELAPRDEPGWDPDEELELLRVMWRVKLAAEGGVPY